jgi:hypothetical protein
MSGYWKRAWREFIGLANEAHVEKQQHKAQAHEAKAGKTFRRTNKHLKKAAKARRKAGGE